jgi:23S rRNA pseudouridine1911/1915/1917 synthase|tara:strand:- start:2893 stop:3852 length:960 start_codon:yes stop_codon:yes gene_type:complete
MSDTIKLEESVPLSFRGMRLDQVASELFKDFSRSRLQVWIKKGDLLVDGNIYRSKDKLIGGELLSVNAMLEPEGEWKPEAISLDIVFEDKDIIVLNKPAGLVVHPAVGNYTGTLLNGLICHVSANEKIPRAGIVHRLDKDTTGLMVVAKTLESHHSLIKQLQSRTVAREYQAIAQGVMTGGGTVKKPMGRHPQIRTKMAVVDHGGKEAVTHYRVIEKFSQYTHIRVKLETGRTHQIRVHMADIGYPLVGDSVYGGRLKLPKGATLKLQTALRGFRRQALHAGRLGLIHPTSNEYVEWHAPAPKDFIVLLEALKTEIDNK